MQAQAKSHASVILFGNIPSLRICEKYTFHLQNKTRNQALEALKEEFEMQIHPLTM